MEWTMASKYKPSRKFQDMTLDQMIEKANELGPVIMDAFLNGSANAGYIRERANLLRELCETASFRELLDWLDKTERTLSRVDLFKSAFPPNVYQKARSWVQEEIHLMAGYVLKAHILKDLNGEEL